MILFSFILCFCFASSKSKNVQNDDINNNDQGDAAAFNEKMQSLISKMSLQQKIGALMINSEWYGRAQNVETKLKRDLITTITPNPNTGVSSQITTTPDSVADIHALLDSLKLKNSAENNFFFGVAKAGQYLVPEIKALRQKLELCTKVMGIIGIRTRILDLADLMYPGGKPHELGIISTFKEILTSKNEKFTSLNTVIVFRQRVTNYSISVNDFLDVLKCIFGSLSDKAAYTMAHFNFRPPKYDDLIGIMNSYDQFGIQPDELKIKVAQIVLEPLPMLSISTTVASGQPLNTPKPKKKALPPTKHDTNTFKIGTDVFAHYISKKKKPLWRCGKIAGYKPEESCYLVEFDDGFQTTCKKKDVFPLPVIKSS